MLTSTLPCPAAVPNSAPKPTGRPARDRSKLLIEEPPLLVLPSLAKAVGINEALVLQQLHYLLGDPANGKLLGGQRWVFNSLGQWIEGYFPFWCERTLWTIFRNLEAQGYISSCQPEGRRSRRKYYTLRQEGLARIMETAAFASSNRQGLRDAMRQNSPEANSQDLPDGIAQELPDGISQELPDGISQGLPDGISQELPDGISQGLRDPGTETSAKMTAETPAEKSPQNSNQTEKRADRRTAPVPALESSETTGAGPAAPTPPIPVPAAMRERPCALQDISDEVGVREIPPASTPARPTDAEWARFMKTRHPELVPNPGWDWCQPFHEECRDWLQQHRQGSSAPRV
jgi:hypothetical protein